MSEKYTIDSLFEATVYDPDGEKVGSVQQVYTDDQTQEPTWVSVSTGLFGTGQTLIPLAEARISGEEIHVPYNRDYIKDAPGLDADKHLDAEDERNLYEYYRRQHHPDPTLDPGRDADRDLVEAPADEDRTPTAAETASADPERPTP